MFDESHNLRNDSGGRWKVFTEWRLANPYAKTLLLTATPINNQLSDLTNQISLGTGGDIGKLGRFQNDSGNYETITTVPLQLHIDNRRVNSVAAFNERRINKRINQNK